MKKDEDEDSSTYQKMNPMKILTKKKTNTKSIQGLVQESIDGVPDLTFLDDIEQVQVRQQRAIIEQREGKENNSQNIGD